MYSNSVPALISKNVGNALSNYKTWGGILYNVKEYNAEGDGVTDDTSAIAAAQAAVAAAGGGILFFPPGTYIYSGRLTLTTGNIIIEGVGAKSVLKCKASTYAPDTLIAATSKNNIVIRNMKFEGNGSLPSADPGSASAAMFFQSCQNVIIEEMEMTNFMGIGVAFSGCTNGLVTRSYFHAMGQDQTGLTPIIAVPAVWSGNSCTDIKVSWSRFYDCRFSGVFHFADGGEISHCTFEHIGESAIYTEYSVSNPTKRTVITNNIIHDCYVVDISASGIECSSNNVAISNNVISSCEGNGIGVGACSYVTVSGNVCFNNNQNPSAGLNGAGIVLQNVFGAVNPDTGKNIVIQGNVCYDDQTVHTQKYGISVSESGGSTTYLRVVIEGNSLYGNTAADLYIKPAPFADASNTARHNTPWPDISRNIGTVTLNTATTSNLKTYTVPAGSMLQNRGIRIKAFGTATGTTGTKTIRLKHNNGTGFVTAAFAAAENGQWVIEAEIYNNSSTSSQIRHRKAWANTGLVDYGTDTATIDTTVDQSIIVQCTLTSASDTIACSGLIVERI